MKVILLHNVKKVGNAGEVIDVADGYANGFLLPKKLARVATKDALAQLQKQKQDIQASKQENQRQEKQLFDAINGTSYQAALQSNDKGSLFAAIHAKDIAAIMQSTSATMFDAQYIELDQPIKEVGEFTIPISVGGHSGSIALTIKQK